MIYLLFALSCFGHGSQPIITTKTCDSMEINHYLVSGSEYHQLIFWRVSPFGDEVQNYITLNNSTRSLTDEEQKAFLDYYEQNFVASRGEREIISARIKQMRVWANPIDCVPQYDYHKRVWFIFLPELMLRIEAPIYFETTTEEDRERENHLYVRSAQDRCELFFQNKVRTR